MYSFAQRPDTKVVDEPLYGYYLKETKANHPGKDEVLNQMETNPEKLVGALVNGKFDAEIVFYKNMAHHLVGLDMGFVAGFSNIILIRDPGEVLVSLSKTLSNISLLDTGFEFQYKIFNELEKVNLKPVVMDSEDLLKNPKGVLSELCHRLEIPFYENMLKWKKGGIPEDGIWAKHWYQNVHNSEGFFSYPKIEKPIPANLVELHDECRYYYDFLSKNKLRV